MAEQVMYDASKTPTRRSGVLAPVKRWLLQHPLVYFVQKYIAPRPWVAAVVLVALLALLSGRILPLRTSPAPLHIAPASAIQMQAHEVDSRTGASSQLPAQVTGNAVPNTPFEIIIENGLYGNDHTTLEVSLRDAFTYVSNNFGSGSKGTFKAALTIEEGCNLHGAAYTDERVMQVFTCDGITSDRAVAIMAHEFVHQLEQDRYGPAHLQSDMILSEGTATWAAKKYWLGGQPDFRSYVQAQRASGVYYPLATNYNGLGIGAMNALYYEWASFVEFLINTYGRDKFDTLYVTGHSSPGSSDYAGVYGKGLDALEQEWLRWLD
jgi:hypothetical protein